MDALLDLRSLQIVACNQPVVEAGSPLYVLKGFVEKEVVGNIASFVDCADPDILKVAIQVVQVHDEEEVEVAVVIACQQQDFAYRPQREP